MQLPPVARILLNGGRCSLLEISTNLRDLLCECWLLGMLNDFAIYYVLERSGAFMIYSVNERPDAFAIYFCK